LVNWHHVHTRRGILDPVFLSTIEGDTMALDGHTRATIWSHRYRDVPCSSTDSLGCEAHTTPAIDPNRRYVYAYALDGRVHKFAAGTGTETMSGGWPEMATAKPTQEKTAGALTIALSGGNTYVFIANEKGISAIRLRLDSAGNPSLVNAWTVRTSCSSMLMVSQVLFCSGGFEHSPPSGTLWARDPRTGAALWHEHIGAIHWQAPIVANGVLYLPDFVGYLNAFTVGRR